MIDLESLVHGPLQLNGIALNQRRFQAMLQLAMRTQQTAAISPQP